MRSRNKNGKFCKNSQEASESSCEAIMVENHVITNFQYFMRALGKLWTLLPYFVVFYLIWRYFKVLKILQELFVELSCGEGCKCLCPNERDILITNSTMTTQSNDVSKKGGL